MAVLVSSLPKPGQPWTFYEVIFTFINGLAANLPQKKIEIPQYENFSPYMKGEKNDSK